MLRLPEECEETPPLIREKRKYGTIAVSSEAAIPEGFKPRQGPRHRRAQDIPEWEAASQEEGYDDASVNSGRWWLLGSLGGIGVLVLALFLAFRPQPTAPQVITETGGIQSSASGALPEPAALPVVPPVEEKKRVDEKPAAGAADKTFVEQGQQVAAKFVAAKSVDELLPLIRGGESMRAIVTAYHKTHPLQPETLRKFAENGSYSQAGPMYFTGIGLSDYSVRQMAFERTTDGKYLVDWENWVGWCESEWEEYRAQRPTKPQLFRVNVKTLEYYNFAFQDETKWRSFRLSSADDESSLYGYVERGSKAEGDLQQAMKGTASASLIVRLAYPEKAPSADQVMIVEVVQDGWSTPQVPSTAAK